MTKLILFNILYLFTTKLKESLLKKKDMHGSALLLINYLVLDIIVLFYRIYWIFIYF